MCCEAAFLLPSRCWPVSAWPSALLHAMHGCQQEFGARRMLWNIRAVPLGLRPRCYSSFLLSLIVYPSIQLVRHAQHPLAASCLGAGNLYPSSVCCCAETSRLSAAKAEQLRVALEAELGSETLIAAYRCGSHLLCNLGWGHVAWLGPCKLLRCRYLRHAQTTSEEVPTEPALKQILGQRLHLCTQINKLLLLEDAVF